MDCRVDYCKCGVLDSNMGEVMSLGRNQNKFNIVFLGRKHQAEREKGNKHSGYGEDSKGKKGG